MKFAKYEGAGNDFIMFDLRDASADALTGETVRRLCARHTGIGADGVIARTGEVMRYFNADGSEGEMCGNGGRCFALFARHLDGERAGGDDGEIRFRAGDGPHRAHVLPLDERTGRVELEMRDVEAVEELADGWALDTGVPHFVVFVDDLAAVDVHTRGRALRHDGRFPRGTNVDFASVAPDGTLHVRTYERGVEAETRACGTGAVAAAIAAHRSGRISGSTVEVFVSGGVLSVSFDPSRGGYRGIRLTGPARRVFTGEVEL